MSFNCPCYRVCLDMTDAKNIEVSKRKRERKMRNGKWNAKKEKCKK